MQAGFGPHRGAVDDSAAKLATARALDETTAIHSLGVTLGLGAVNAKEVCAALDWLGAAQPSRTNSSRPGSTITALRAPAIQNLAAEGGPLQLSLFDERDLAEIKSPDFPGERLPQP